jgi:ribonucleoside-diphosphate reductase alpha chain
MKSMVTTRAALHAVPTGTKGAGLKIERHFTTAGVHPYDELEWELRDAVIKDWRTGEPSFEQRDVEFPTSWSLNATTIVAQKYFRGTMGTPERERSVKHMIDRVADTIAAWGVKDGYFADADSAETFNDELKHLLVHQKAAFNSPVWFNVGVEETPQCSACFILSVEDKMSSILNWYVEEGTIFKGGSGSGVNLSKIRSSKENLKGGGEASGPVSFMRGADASAGTIKSGGKTRRAAKMVILDVDHPDIEEFIWCKQREEVKARALREAGFDMELDGLDSASVQYQNANNSVRVNDTFMEAVEADGDFELVGVTDGEVKKRVKARDLMRQIAQAAWECADPGMQYDTTINDWHTTPNAGRINGSNPCSEYMHLDNSACNLASLNLRKFEEGGVFDVEAFKRAVEIVFTAQEIIVGNSSYPTEGIGENARKYRQLGLGYANLGGLLMSQGLAYDSEQGRAWAAAITALMTGHAYRTSAELAKVQGPFEGYADDAEGTLRVIAKHGEAVQGIDADLAPANILEAARQSWTDALELGTANGIRNAQASVLAPTGCLTGGSLVATERGLVRLTSLGDPAGEQWQDLDVAVATDEGPRQATKFYVNGLESVVTVDTGRGYRIQGTPKHRIKVVQPDGTWEWKRFGDLAEGDRVPLALDQLVGSPQVVSLPPLGEGYWTGERHATAPRQMTAELAELLGYFMGDGSLHARGIRLCVADGDFEVVERLAQLGKALFGLEAKVSPQTGYTEVAFHSVRLVEWWEACGFAKHEPRPGHTGKGWQPHIPDAVLHANDRAVYAAFVRGLFEADGTVTVGYPHWSSTSLEFSRDVQSLLLALGYPTTRKLDTTGWGQSQLAVLRLLNSSYNERWLDEVGFLSDRKNAAVEIKASQQSARHDKIPVSRELINRVAPDNDRFRRVMLMEHNRSGSVSRRIADEVFAATGDPELGHLLGFYYDTVASAELGEDELTYDLSVPDNVTYIANGFVSHNTIGLMMDCDTTGIEPDLGLVKAKKMVGGGSMRIVNQTVPVGLAKLGYQPEQIEAILAYIDEHATIEGAPAFKDEHLPVFDCAMGERSISPEGHIHMMAAVQPFISGAISKTVNLPETASVEDVEDLYIEGWKLGLKAVAIYRDNCKVAQPLSIDKKKAAEAPVAATTDEAAAHGMVRRRLPKQRPSQTISFQVGDAEGYLTAGEYPGDGLGEIFVKLGKQGSTLSGVMDAFAISVSLGLQYGVPLEAYVSKFTNMRFDPAGMTDDPEVKFASSIVDYLFRRLAIEYMPIEQRQALGIYTMEERNAALEGGGYASTATAEPETPKADAEGQIVLPVDKPAAIDDIYGDAPMCYSCGIQMQRAGSCHVCSSCGTTSGCS